MASLPASSPAPAAALLAAAAAVAMLSSRSLRSIFFCNVTWGEQWEAHAHGLGSTLYLQQAGQTRQTRSIDINQGWKLSDERQLMLSYKDTLYLRQQKRLHPQRTATARTQSQSTPPQGHTCRVVDLTVPQKGVRKRCEKKV